MLVVEVDGLHHSAPEQKAYDEERSAYLAALGLHILRFQNYEVDDVLPEVCKQIAAIADVRQQTPKLLPEEGAPPAGGEEGFAERHLLSRSKQS